ncbi:tRNA pseudouridine(55) synthase TruB [Candidatus Thioglobus sp.]|nr:tRNA pseudouridine(55) synthase TruB [Candidatus Thioglobus sp.]
MSKRNPKGRDINGVLLLDKASGHSSNSALQDVKRLFDANKAGHTGSLDPLASGLLPICLGQATKVAQFLLNGDKRYFVRGKLGQISDTGDSDGQVVDFGSTKGVNEQAIKNVLLDFAGSINQVPPMYSALKRNGTPLYKLARKGIEVEREARPVTIHEIKFKGFKEEILSLEVSCSKGTYIRTLIEDIGESLGCGGHVIELRRVGFTHFDIPQARTFEELVELKNKGLSELDATLLCADEMLPNLKGLYLDAEQTLDIKHGRKVQFSGLDVGQKIKLYDEKKQFIGIGENNVLSEVWPKRVFV